MLEGCNGVKTGFTDDAGRCLVSSCQRDGMDVVCVVLNCRPMFEDSANLINKAFEEYKMFDLTSGYSYDKNITVEEGRKDKIGIETRGNFFYPLKKNELGKIRYEYNIMKSVEAPVSKGSEIGDIKIFLDKNLLFSDKIYTMEEVRRNSMWTRLKDLVEAW